MSILLVVKSFFRAKDDNRRDDGLAGLCGGRGNDTRGEGGDIAKGWMVVIVSDSVLSADCEVTGEGVKCILISPDDEFCDSIMLVNMDRSCCDSSRSLSSNCLDRFCNQSPAWSAGSS